MTDFLDDQFAQLSKITESYKSDITILDNIVRSWEELPEKDINKLSEMIESKICNKTTIEIYQDENDQYILDLKFAPINVIWALQIDNQNL